MGGFLFDDQGFVAHSASLIKVNDEELNNKIMEMNIPKLKLDGEGRKSMILPNKNLNMSKAANIAMNSARRKSKLDQSSCKKTFGKTLGVERTKTVGFQLQSNKLSLSNSSSTSSNRFGSEASSKN